MLQICAGMHPALFFRLANHSGVNKYLYRIVPASMDQDDPTMPNHDNWSSYTEQIQQKVDAGIAQNKDDMLEIRKQIAELGDAVKSVARPQVPEKNILPL